MFHGIRHINTLWAVLLVSAISAKADAQSNDGVQVFVEPIRQDGEQNQFKLSLANSSFDPYGYCQIFARLPIQKVNGQDGSTYTANLKKTEFAGIPMGQDEHIFTLDDMSLPSGSAGDWQFHADGFNSPGVNFSIVSVCSPMTTQGWCERYAGKLSSSEPHFDSVRQMLYAYQLIPTPTASWKKQLCDSSSFLSKIARRNELSLLNRKISSLLPLASLPITKLSLESVSSRNWDFKNLQFSNLVQVQLLDSDLSLAPISELNHLPYLEELRLDFSKLLGTLELADFPSLRSLSLGMNPGLRSLALTNMFSLEDVNASSSTLEDLALHEVPGLKRLNLSYTNVKVPNLELQTELVFLDLSFNKSVLLDPERNIHKLPESLEELNLQSAGLDSLAFASRLPNLRVLRISGNRIVNLKPLAQLQKLEILEVDGNPVALSTENCPISEAQSAIVRETCNKLLFP